MSRLADQEMADYDKRRRDLFWALRTRLLTEAELEEARGMGSSLNIQMQVSYHPEQKARELSDAWSVQGMWQIAAMKQGNGYVGGANNSLFEIRELGT